MNQSRRNNIVVGKCLKCQQNANLRYSEKNQSYFIGCSKFPECRWVQSLPNYIESVVESENTCSKCGGKKVVIKAKEGKIIESFIMRIRFQ